MTTTTEQETSAPAEEYAGAIEEATSRHEAEGAQFGHVHRAVWRMMQDVAWIGKTERMSAGGGGNYDYRGIDQVLAALGNRARVYGLALQTRIITPPTYVEHEKRKGNGDVTVWTTCRGLVMRFSWTSLRDGSTLSAEGLGEGRDSGDKASNKAVTAALKQAMTHSTILPTMEVDPDAYRNEIEGDDPADAGGDPGPADVLAGIRQAPDLATLHRIYDWLDERSLLGEEIEGQTFMQHLDGAKFALDPQGGEPSAAEVAGERGDEPNEYADGEG